jgi:amidase
MSGKRVHAFCDDILSDHDAVALAEMIRRREVTSGELTEAAIERADVVNLTLNAIELSYFDQAREAAKSPRPGAFSGVPSFIKDNTDIAGQPTRHGSLAVPTVPALEDGTFAKQYLSLGFNLLGKTRLPEFGFNCSTEYDSSEPTRNPWHSDYSCGGSSGGSAALVAAGVVPVAHANDGGGSIRIPAACCGLIGLKVTRGRFVTHEMAKSLPINVVCDGVVTRTVRDTAHFVAGAEQYWSSPKLSKIGLVEGPAKRRLRVALAMDSLTGSPCPETRQAVEQTAQLLESLGHRVDEMPNNPVKQSFVNDFVDYWAFLAFMTGLLGKKKFGEQFDPQRLDGFTRGLAQRFKRRGWRLPMVLMRLNRTWQNYVESMKNYDLILTPVLGHVTPKLGYVSPDVPFEELIERLMQYAAFTPLNNANGSPAIALPIGLSPDGLPIGVQLAAAHGDERSLIELAFEIEQAKPWARIEHSMLALN